MTRTLDVHPSAQAEAEAAARYYAERSARAAGAFVDELDDATARIELAPHAFLQHVHGTRRLLLRTFPFAVVYRFDDDAILIVAIVHSLPLGAAQLAHPLTLGCVSASAWIANEAARIVDVAYRAGGGAALHDSSPLQRRLRDAHAVTQHVILSEAALARHGAALTRIQ